MSQGRLTREDLDPKFIEELDNTSARLEEVEGRSTQHSNDRDNPHGVTAEQLGLGNVQNFSIATQEESEAGIDNDKYMTPQNTKQAIDKNLQNTVTKDDTIPVAGKSISALIKTPVNIKRINGKTTINYIPLFTSGLWNLMMSKTIIESKHKIAIIATDINDHGHISIPVKAGSQYTLSAKHNGVIGINYLNDADGVLGSVDYTTSQSVTFTTPSGTTKIRVWVKASAATGRFTFEDIILVDGAIAQSFVSDFKGVTNPTIMNETNNTSYTVPTTLYTGESVFLTTDGTLVKEKKWKDHYFNKLDNWQFGNHGNGYKEIFIPLPVDSRASLFLVKSNGVILESMGVTGEMLPKADTYRIAGSNLFIAVSNNDSGWGPNFTPSQYEINAYILGYRLYDSENNPSGVRTPYVRTDGLRKDWLYVKSDGLFQGVGTPAPLNPAPINDYWKPYRMIYEMLVPVLKNVEPHGDFVLEKGINVLKLFSGRIVNEIASIQHHEGKSFINGTGKPLSKRVNTFLNVYRNTIKDTSTINLPIDDPSSIKISGLNYLYLPEYDFKSSYAVDYVPLDVWDVSVPTGDIQISYSESINSVINEMLRDQATNNSILKRIHENVINKGTPVDEFSFSMTLSSGWQHLHTVTVTKETSGYVNIDGSVWGGITANDTVLGILPVQLRPPRSILFTAFNYDYNNVVYPCGVTIDRDGIIKIKGVKHNAALGLAGIRFKI